MTQKKAQLMFPPTSGRLGAVKAGTGISIGVDGTICATGGSGGGVFSADANNNIWSCLTTPTPPYVESDACENFIAGYCAGTQINGAYRNVIIGSYAGACLEYGGANIIIGYEAAKNGTYGWGNNFLGSYTGCSNSSGFYNNFLGWQAGMYNTSGESNNALGGSAGRDNTTGSSNNFFGAGAGALNTVGSYNNYFGESAGFWGDGDHNNLFGCKAGYCNTGTHNNFIGMAAGGFGYPEGNSGSFNNFIGSEAGRQHKTGDFNNFIGKYAGKNSSFGYNNNFIGNCSGQHESGGYNNYIGTCAGKGIEATGRIGGWDIDSSTIIPVAETTYYSVEVSTTGGTYIYGTLVRDDWPTSGVLLGQGDSVLLSGGGPIIDGETIVIPGNQIGGSSPADDATITLYAGTGENVNESSIAIGNYAASENSGDSCSNIAIGNYAGQYTGWNGEFNHIFIGTQAGQMAFGGFYNIYIGGSAGQCAGGEGSFSNTFIGTYAGRLAANSFYQTFVGAYSGISVVNPNGWTGPGNQLFGAFSGYALTTGVANSMFGSYAGYCATTGTYNSFFGVFAGEGFTTGSCNAIFGSYSGTQSYYDAGFAGNPAGPRSSTGSNNTNIGSRSGTFQPGDSSGNVAVGYKSNTGTLYGLCALSVLPSTAVPSEAYCSYVISTDCVSTASLCGGDPGLIKVFRDGAGTVCDVSVIDPGFRQQYRTFTCIPGTLIGGTSADDLPIASRTLFSSNDTCNFENTLIGPYAGQMTAFGTRNFFGGFRAGGWSGDYAADNVAIGSYAGFCMGGSYNIAIGSCAGYHNTAGESNNFIGNSAGFCNTSGTNNNFFGSFAGFNNTTGENNNFLGNNAGCNNTTGNYNNFFGSLTGFCNTSGSYNNFTGFWTGRCNTTGCYNNFYGSIAGERNTTGCYNTFVGELAGQFNTTGNRNSFFGHLAGQCATGSFNAAIGNGALRDSSGCFNAALGHFAGGVGNQPGCCNIYLGYYSGPIPSGQTGANNTYIGFRAGCATALNSTSANNILIGCLAGGDAVATITTQSNQIVVGNNAHTNAFIKIGWTVTSDERDKTCVTSVRHGLDFLDQITPVRFNWKDRETGEVTDETPRYGFLAQDILAAEGDPAILVDTQDPDNLKLRESMMIPVLVQAIKELHEEVKALKQQLQP